MMLINWAFFKGRSLFPRQNEHSNIAITIRFWRNQGSVVAVLHNTLKYKTEKIRRTFCQYKCLLVPQCLSSPLTTCGLAVIDVRMLVKPFIVRGNMQTPIYHHIRIESINNDYFVWLNNWNWVSTVIFVQHCVTLPALWSSAKYTRPLAALMNCNHRKHKKYMSPPSPCLNNSQQLGKKSKKIMIRINIGTTNQKLPVHIMYIDDQHNGS